MTSQQIIRAATSICSGSSVCCTTYEWSYRYNDGSRKPKTSCTLSIVPGLNGDECTRIEGRDWQHCADQLYETITVVLENKLREPQADVTMDYDSETVLGGDGVLRSIP